MTVSIATAYIGGLLTLFAPCAAMLIPGFLAYAAAERRHLLGRTALFTLGLVVALAPLGFLAGSLGAAVKLNQYTLTAIMGVIVIIMGIWQAFALPMPDFSGAPRVGGGAKVAPISGVNLPGVAMAGAAGGVQSLQVSNAATVAQVGSSSSDAESSANFRPSVVELPDSAKSSNPWAVFGLGVGYGLAGVGCSGPILGAMLSLTFGSKSSLSGGFMMVFYALGMATPVAILALLWESLRLSERKFMKPTPIKVLGRWTTRGSFISGILFVVLGVIMIFTGGHNFLPSVISDETQVDWETSIINATSAVPWWLFAALIVVVVALIWVWMRYYRKPSKSGNRMK